MNTRTSTASARWLKDTVTGSGTISTGSGALLDTPLTWPSRIGNEEGCTPEEMLAAAHAGCFAMALSFALSSDGHMPTQLDVSAACEFEFTGTGASVTTMHLSVDGQVPGIDQERFAELAASAKQGCPVSRVYEGNIEITLEARLVSLAAS